MFFQYTKKELGVLLGTLSLDRTLMPSFLQVLDNMYMYRIEALWYFTFGRALRFISPVAFPSFDPFDNQELLLELLFMPKEKVPLYLNHKSLLARDVILWRLKLNK